MNIHSLIRREREVRGWSMEELASRVAQAEGLSKPLAWQTVQQWEKEGGTAPKRKRLEIVAKLFGISVAELLNAEGQATSASVGTPILLQNNPDYPAIRRVRFKLSAGASGFAVEYLEDEDAPIVFRRQWFDSNGYNPDKLFATKVANGSMEPGLYHGDTVVVNTEQTNPKDGIVFAANFEGELVIKRLVRDAGEWWLSSDNPDQRRHPRKVCDENVFLIGEIVHKQSERI